MSTAEIVAWLESPEGERWSSLHHKSGPWGPSGFRSALLPYGEFFSLKDDRLQIHRDTYHEIDRLIRNDIARYGMNGIPDREGFRESSLTSQNSSVT